MEDNLIIKKAFSLLQMKLKHFLLIGNLHRNWQSCIKFQYRYFRFCVCMLTAFVIYNFRFELLDIYLSKKRSLHKMILIERGGNCLLMQLP